MCMYIGTEKLKNMRKISILDLKYTFEEQNMLFLVLAVLVYLVFRVNGGSLELLYSLFGQCYLLANSKSDINYFGPLSCINSKLFKVQG